MVAEVVADLGANHETVPEPLAGRAYSGRFMVCIPPALHRKLAIEAAEAGLSMNRLVSDKLSQKC